MITKPTVIVIGAGASCESFPTSLALPGHLKERYVNGSPGRLGELGHSAEEIADFIQRFRRANTTIDEFLRGNKSDRLLGQRIIADVYLSAEEPEALIVPKSREVWYLPFFDWFFGESVDDLPKSKVYFLTFNYDRSFEEFLFQTYLNRFLDHVDAEYAAKFISERVVHLRGDLGPLDWQHGDGIAFGSVPSAQHIASVADKLTFAWQNDTSPEFDRRHDCWFADVEKILFLGFGFGSNNVALLKLEEIISRQSPEIWATVYGLAEGDSQRLRDSYRVQCYAANVNVLQFFGHLRNRTTMQW